MKKRIAVVDDDEAILEICKIVLESEDYEVDTYVSGKPLYELQEPLPDLVLLDVLLSGEDGREICMYLKQHQATKHIPVILFSAHAKADIQETMPDGTRPDQFMAKPFDLQELTDNVAELLDEG